MPASRSRTENWRRSLVNLRDRNGALEITLPRNFDGAGGGFEDGTAIRDLIWRVRILDLSDEEILVEEPMVLGHAIHIEDGREIVAIIAVGQNRWMFRTTILGRHPCRLNPTTEVTALRLAMPSRVERCQRRNFYRVSTVGLTLPRVECYPLLDPKSAVDAEIANRLDIEGLTDTPIAGRIGPEQPPETPVVGPLLGSTLVNIGGGGVGLIISPTDRAAFESHRTFWLRIPLEPFIPAPLAVTARLRHTHIDSSQRLYAGLQFDFSCNPPHEKFVVDQVCRYVAQVQREQLARQNSA